MKILHVNDYAYAGGCEVLMNNTVNWLRQRGLDVEIFTGDEVTDLRKTPWSYIDSRQCRRALARKLESFKPDIVHLHNFYHVLSPGILVTLENWHQRTGGKVIMTAHDYHLICPNSGLQRFSLGNLVPVDLEHVEHWRYLLTSRWDHRSRMHSTLKLLQHVWNYRFLRRHRAIDVIICPSRYIASMMGEFVTTYLPHPAPEIQSNTSVRSTDKLRLVYVGRIEPEKGLHSFLHIVPDSFADEFIIVGDGSAKGRCEAFCRQRGLTGKVQFCGSLPHDKTMEQIEQAHVLVLPSTCPENHPMSLLEALAVGTNILTTNLGGMRETVSSSGIGYLFQHDRPETLVAALNDIRQDFHAGILNSFDVSEYLGQRNREVYLQRLLDLYGISDEEHG